MTDLDRLAEITRRYKPGVNNDVDYLLNQLTHAQMATERLRELLARLEWNKDGHCNGCTGFRYESGSMTHGHEPGCWVAAEP